jgi:hypothetical protein
VVRVPFVHVSRSRFAQKDIDMPLPRWRFRTLMLAVLAGVMVTASASAAEPAPSQTHISPNAIKLLKAVSDTLGTAGAFTFHADILFDHVLPTGQKLQYAAKEDVALERPDHLYVEWKGDLGDRQFWYTGKSVMLYDPATMFYAGEAASGGIDAVLEKATADAGFKPPLSDLFYSAPYAMLSDRLVYGADLGMTEVNGARCHALAFVEKEIDWQIWISDGPKPVPCKLVLTYKTHPAQPQFSAVFSAWDFAPKFDAKAFAPDVPANLKRVPFAKITAAK